MYKYTRIRARAHFSHIHLGVVPTLTPWLYLSYQSIAVMGEGSVCSLRLHLPEHLHLLWQPAVKPFSFHTLKLPPGMDGGKKITLTGWDCFSTSAVSCHFKRHGVRLCPAVWTDACVVLMNVFFCVSPQDAVV